MFTAITFKCGACNVPLPYNQAFLKDGNLVATCPNCHRDSIIEAHPKCGRCSRQAIHMTMDYLANSGTYRAEYRCDLHNISWGSLKCANCGRKLPKKVVRLHDSKLAAMCSRCKTETVIQNEVTCDHCSDRAVYLRWVNNPDFLFGFLDKLPKLTCDKHKFEI